MVLFWGALISGVIGKKKAEEQAEAKKEVAELRAEASESDPWESSGSGGNIGIWVIVGFVVIVLGFVLVKVFRKK